MARKEKSIAAIDGNQSTSEPIKLYVNGVEVDTSKLDAAIAAVDLIDNKARERTEFIGESQMPTDAYAGPAHFHPYFTGSMSVRSINRKLSDLVDIKIVDIKIVAAGPRCPVPLETEDAFYQRPMLKHDIPILLYAKPDFHDEEKDEMVHQKFDADEARDPDPDWLVFDCLLVSEKWVCVGLAERNPNDPVVEDASDEVMACEYSATLRVSQETLLDDNRRAMDWLVQQFLVDHMPAQIAAHRLPSRAERMAAEKATNDALNPQMTLENRDARLDAEFDALMVLNESAMGARLGECSRSTLVYFASKLQVTGIDDNTDAENVRILVFDGVRQAKKEPDAE